MILDAVGHRYGKRPSELLKDGNFEDLSIDWLCVLDAIRRGKEFVEAKAAISVIPIL